MPEDQLLRTSIAADAIARLAAAGIVPPGRVYGFRTTRLPADKLPALLVYLGTGRGTGLSEAAPFLRWAIPVIVQCCATGADDDAMAANARAMADAVEATLARDPEWVRQFEKIVGVDYDEGVPDDPGAQRMAVAILTFGVQFCHSHPPNLDTAAPLSTVAVTVDTMPPDGSPEAHATIPL